MPSVLFLHHHHQDNCVTLKLKLALTVIKIKTLYIQWLVLNTTLEFCVRLPLQMNNLTSFGFFCPIINQPCPQLQSALLNLRLMEKIIRSVDLIKLLLNKKLQGLGQKIFSNITF